MYVNLQVRPELVLLAVARISAHATVDVLVECALHAIFRVRVVMLVVVAVACLLVVIRWLNCENVS